MFEGTEVGIWIFVEFARKLCLRMHPISSEAFVLQVFQLELSMVFRNLNRSILVLLFLFSIWSCEPNLITSPEDLPPAIFVFLNTVADSQYVIIQASVPSEGGKQQVIDAENGRIRQAKVEVEGGGAQFVFNKPYEVDKDYLDSRSFVFASAQTVHAGETYHLRVEIPGKGVFTSAATAPGDFDILAPNSVDTIDVFQPLEVRTTVAQGTAGYRVTLWSHVIDSTDFKAGVDSMPRIFWGGTDRYFSTSEEPVGILSHHLPYFYKNPDNRDYQILQMQLSVEALDTTALLTRAVYFGSPYHPSGDYNSGEEFRLEPVAFSNIEGGRGVMTAITTKKIPLRFPPLPR